MKKLILSSVIATSTLFFDISTAIAQQAFNQPVIQDKSAASNQAVIFIELTAPPTAKMVAKHIKNTGSAPSKQQQQDYSRKLTQSQKKLKDALTAFDAVYISSFKVSANGIKCKVDKSAITNIRSLPGVKSVTLVTSVKASSVDIDFNNFSHLNIVNATALPNLEASDKKSQKDITVAVIDTGVDYYQVSLGGTGARNSDDGTTAELGTFPTQRVSGIDLAGTHYDPDDPENNIPQPDNDPLDFLDHGTLSANIIGAEPREGIIAGLAPNVKILAIKAFGDNGTRSDLLAEGIEYAMDPNGDGSTDDHADIINLSTASPFGSTRNVVSIAVDNAIAMGAVVVAAAGNNGNIPFIIGSPSVANEAISVGSTADFVTSKLQFNFDGNEQQFSSLSVSFTSQNAFSGELKFFSNDDGCAPLPTSFKDSVVVFKYKECNGEFMQAQHAQNAQASGVIVIRDVPSRRVAASLFNQPSITARHVSPEVGQFLIDQLTQSQQATVVHDLSDPSNRGLISSIADFSSRGFNGGEGTFKPDVTAPGVNIGAGDSFSETGTSFSAPIVSGLAALILQKTPTLSPEAVKALIVNATTPVRKFEFDDAPFEPVSRQGAGSINAHKALTLTSFAAPGGLGFGMITATKKESIVRTFTLHNLRDERRHFEFSHTKGASLPGVTLRFPRSVHIPANASREVNVRMVVDPRQLPALQNTIDTKEVDGWLTVSDAFDSLQVAYAASVEATTDITVNAIGTRFELQNNSRISGTAVAYAQSETSELDVLDRDTAFFPELIGYRLDADNHLLTISLTYPTIFKAPSSLLGEIDITASLTDGSFVGSANVTFADAGFLDGEGFKPLDELLQSSFSGLYTTNARIDNNEPNIFQNAFIIDADFNRRTYTIGITLNKAFASDYENLVIDGLYFNPILIDSFIGFTLPALGKQGLNLPKLELEKNDEVTTQAINTLETDIFWVAPKNGTEIVINTTD